MALQFALIATGLNIWHRMALAYVVLIPLAVVLCKPGWRALFAWNTKHAVAGVTATIVMLAATFAVVYGIRAWSPELSAQIAGLMAWKSLVPAWQMWPLLIWVIFGEEIVWRGGVTMGFAKFGFWPAVGLGAVAFTLFHLAFGPPLLLVAAFGAGAVWSWLLLRYKSIWPPLICHLAWDVTVMLTLPLG
ncbi:MAG: CPBP family intramembrane metalloprotease [Planctomycetes bacterium]|nr:CPBP family intramembrane metalloprotease [Planctomycetota bacterium]